MGGELLTIEQLNSKETSRELGLDPPRTPIENVLYAFQYFGFNWDTKTKKIKEMFDMTPTYKTVISSMNKNNYYGEEQDNEKIKNYLKTLYNASNAAAADPEKLDAEETAWVDPEKLYDTHLIELQSLGKEDLITRLLKCERDLLQTEKLNGGRKASARKSLDDCTVAELKERAAKRGINVTGLKKAEIIAKLRGKR